MHKHSSLSGPTLYGLYRADALGPGMPNITLIQCLVFSAVIVAVDPVAVRYNYNIYSKYLDTYMYYIYLKYWDTLTPYLDCLPSN